MIGKLIAYGTDRDRARQHAITALKNYAIHGIDTNLAYLIALLSTDDFRDNRISTHYCDEHTPRIIERMKEQKAALDRLPVVLAGLLYSFNAPEDDPATVWQEIGFWRLVPALEITLDDAPVAIELREIAPGRYQATHDDQEHAVQIVAQQEGRIDFRLNDALHTAYVSETEEGALVVTQAGFNFRLRRNDLPNKTRLVGSTVLATASDDTVVSPMPGKVIALHVQAGDAVKRGDTLLVVEAMKMENALMAPRDGTVQEVRVALDDRIERNVPLILLEAAPY
jgi:3-methylcrotonyl-CoA carboxylase alpha subunit